MAVAVSWLGVFALRSRGERLFGQDEDARNGLVELVLTGTGLFYGLLLGLIAAASYTNFADTESVVNEEATAVTALYRDVSNYPEPVRGELRGDIEDYVDSVINEAWPHQQEGEVPVEGIIRIDAIQDGSPASSPRRKGT